MSSLQDQLEQGLTALGVTAAPGVRQRLLDYLELLVKWNRVYNLTAVREPEKMVSTHLLDCLAVIPHVAAAHTLDIGSGAGLPGIPLALMWPNERVTLLDSNSKKAAFLRQAAIELKLANVDVVCERAETWRAPHAYQLVISRAVAELAEFAVLARGFCARDGALAAMKGAYPRDEIAALPREVALKEVIELAVPGLRAQRHLVLLAPCRK